MKKILLIFLAIGLNSFAQEEEIPLEVKTVEGEITINRTRNPKEIKRKEKKIDESLKTYEEFFEKAKKEKEEWKAKQKEIPE